MTRLTALALLAAFSAGPACAQTMYRGYDIGPDYGAMIRQQQAIQNQRNAQMQQQQNQVVQSAMQDPRCQQAYQQHRMQGGGMAYPQFAYECARTGRFTPQGMAYANQVEQQNAMRERQALMGLRQAEQNRAAAQSEYANRFQRNNAEFGNGLAGRGSYVDPGTGAPMVLQNIRPGQQTVDPNTGRRYAMDQQGNYFVQGPNGMWSQMAPMR